jgi:hypothetical protein
VDEADERIAHGHPRPDGYLDLPAGSERGLCGRRDGEFHAGAHRDGLGDSQGSTIYRSDDAGKTWKTLEAASTTTAATPAHSRRPEPAGQARLALERAPLRRLRVPDVADEAVAVRTSAIRRTTTARFASIPTTSSTSLC